MQGDDVGCRERCDHTFLSGRRMDGGSLELDRQGAPAGSAVPWDPSPVKSLLLEGTGLWIPIPGGRRARSCPGHSCAGAHYFTGKDFTAASRLPEIPLSLHTFTALPLPFSACQGRQYPSHPLCASTDYFGNVHHGMEQEMMDCLEKE